MRTLKLTVQYDGTRYHGFQRQKGRVTVQEALEDAVEAVTGERAPVVGAGRTDAGVHARGQVVSFKTGSRIPAERIPYALNSRLPPDVVVVGAEEVPSSFHARYDAVSKVYSYSILNRPFPSPFWARYALHWPWGLDVDTMARAAEGLRGRHDFAAFRSSGGASRSTVRTVLRSRLSREGELLRYVIEADGFLYNMVRIIVGTLLEIGRGAMPAWGLDSAVRGRRRELAGPTAPAHGLCLEEVRYRSSGREPEGDSPPGVP